MRNTPEFFLFCIAEKMLANVGKWDDACLPPTEPTPDERHLGRVVRNFIEFFAFARHVKPEPDPTPPIPDPWQSLTLGLPFMVFAYDTVTGEVRYAIPYSNIPEIVGLWGKVPSLVPLAGGYDLPPVVPVRDLESFDAFPAWDVTAARAAAGFEQPSDPRIA